MTFRVNRESLGRAILKLLYCNAGSFPESSHWTRFRSPDLDTGEGGISRYCENVIRRGSILGVKGRSQASQLHLYCASASGGQSVVSRRVGTYGTNSAENLASDPA